MLKVFNFRKPTGVATTGRTFQRGGNQSQEFKNLMCGKTSPGFSALQTTRKKTHKRGRNMYFINCQLCKTGETTQHPVCAGLVSTVKTLRMATSTFPRLKKARSSEPLSTFVKALQNNCEEIGLIPSKSQGQPFWGPMRSRRTWYQKEHVQHSWDYVLLSPLGLKGTLHNTIYRFYWCNYFLEPLGYKDTCHNTII